MTFIAIAVVGENRVIGNGLDQPFKFKDDWKRFKQVTMGHPLIMGRKTHESMGLLPGRLSIVITRRPEAIEFPTDDEGRPRGYAVDSLAKAMEVALSRDDVAYVVGGGQIYREAWSHLDELDITEVHDSAEGDVTFPEIDPDEWQEVSRQPGPEFDFVRYERRRGLNDV